jgi:hypothetical protein
MADDRYDDDLKPIMNQLPRPDTPPPSYNHNIESALDMGEAEEYEDAPMSPITIIITSPLRVTGANNYIAIDTVNQGVHIAHHIIDALKNASMAHGLPVIDEEGRPRPINITVDVPITIDGEKNVVGQKEVLAALSAQKMEMMRNKAVQGDQSRKRIASGDPEEGSQADSPKRSRQGER